MVAGNYVAYGAALRGIDGFLELGIGGAVLMGALVLATTHKRPCYICDAKPGQPHDEAEHRRVEREVARQPLG